MNYPAYLLLYPIICVDTLFFGQIKLVILHLYVLVYNMRTIYVNLQLNNMNVSNDSFVQLEMNYEEKSVLNFVSIFKKK